MRPKRKAFRAMLANETVVEITDIQILYQDAFKSFARYRIAFSLNDGSDEIIQRTLSYLRERKIQCFWYKWPAMSNGLPRGITFRFVNERDIAPVYLTIGSVSSNIDRYEFTARKIDEKID